MEENQYIIVASHRRSGTHWTIDAIRNNFSDVSKDFFNLENILPDQDEHISLNDANHFLSNKKKIIIKTHALPSFDNFLCSFDITNFVSSIVNNSKIIYVYRDGRDVLVSLYYYRRHFDDKVNRMSFSDFIRMPNDFDATEEVESLNRIEYWMHHVKSWINGPEILSVSYEQLHSDYNDVVSRIAEYIEAPQNVRMPFQEIKLNDKNPVEGGVGVGKYLKIFKRNQVRPSSAILPRKGVVGDWKNHFTKDDEKYFIQIAGALLKDLGYKSD